MQSWSRQSQCVFCLLRRGVSQQTAISARRDLHTTPTSKPKRSHRPSKSGRGVFDKSRSNYRERRDETEHGFRRVLINKDEKGAREARRSLILKALKEIHKHYIHAKTSSTSDVPQMRMLDPEGVLWPQFESLVKDAANSGLSFGNRSSLAAGILDASQNSDHDTLVKEMQFSFLDYVLDNTRSATEVGLRTKYDIKYPTEWYHQTRQMQRAIHLHVGPTNSGKTYNALKRLEAARDGFYAGPLRLLAHEVYSRFNNRQIKCDLVTGDDVRLDETGDVKLYASTVEMVDINRECEVGVVDEIQMIGDLERGWAWSRALMGARCKELHLCGEARTVPLIRQLVASMGDTLHIHQYERLNPLKVMSRSLKGNLKNLRKGDCVVSFSVVNIHALKKQIELDTGRRCAIVYGSLPPETRAQQAALFNDPDNDYDYLVASDAIGMGLNLSIKRIVFETTSKWNGTSRERLSIPQLKQIGGRAGRYRSSQDDKTAQAKSSGPASTKDTKPRNIGLITCLDEMDIPVLQHALSSEGTPLQVAGLLPPGEVFDDLSQALPEDTPFEYILRRVCASLATNPRFKICNIKDQLQIARWLEEVKGLEIRTRLLLCAAPASYRVGPVKVGSPQKLMVELAKTIAGNSTVTVADLAEIPLEVLDEPMTADRDYLASLEALHKSLILYLWLHYRFSRRLTDRDMAFRAKELCEERINTTLLRFSANPKLVKRLKEMRKSSDMLIQQAGVSQMAAGSGVTLNPDRTVEEIEAAEMQAIPSSRGLSQLDIGDGEAVAEINSAPAEPDFQDHADEEENDTEPARSVQGSG